MDENVIHGDQLENDEEWTDHPALDGKWRNYGDANPDLYGGAWVRFDPDGEYWEVVRTTSGHDLPTGYITASVGAELVRFMETETGEKFPVESDKEFEWFLENNPDALDNVQLVETTQVYPDEIWSDGEPDRTGMDESGEPVYGWSEFMTEVETSMGPYTANGNMDFGFIESAIGNDWFFLHGGDARHTLEVATYKNVLGRHGVLKEGAADPDYYDFW